MALASGARISELAALSRDDGFVVFSDSDALLKPHLKFLAKNEDPQNRWKPWKILALPQDPSLCPVLTLKDYLKRTAAFKSGPLFRREKGGNISLDGIKQQILYLIKRTNPGSVPTVHQVRKAATSLNFFQQMQFDPLKEYTGWKSSKVFLKHYCVNMEALKYHAVAAGKVVGPHPSGGSDI